MSFSESVIEAVWRKGATIAGYDPAVWRKDRCRALMKRSEHGNRNSNHGWEVHHTQPGGPDEIWNLEPLHWRNNVATGDGQLRCVVNS